MSLEVTTAARIADEEAAVAKAVVTSNDTTHPDIVENPVLEFFSSLRIEYLKRKSAAAAEGEPKKISDEDTVFPLIIEDTMEQILLF